MKAVILEGKQKIVVTDVPDPKIETPADAIIKVTYTKVLLKPDIDKK